MIQVTFVAGKVISEPNSQEAYGFRGTKRYFCLNFNASRTRRAPSTSSLLTVGTRERRNIQTKKIYREVNICFRIWENEDEGCGTFSK